MKNAIWGTVITILLYCPAAAQPPTLKAACDHVSGSHARFEALRLLPPAIVQVDGNQVVATADKLTIMLTLREGSVVDKPKKQPERWWVLYSICDRTVETLVPVLPSQMK
jgi:hypothetical protein